MTTAQKAAIEEIRKRVEAAQSFGYGVTHYQADGRVLLAVIDGLEKKIAAMEAR